MTVAATGLYLGKDARAHPGHQGPTNYVREAKKRKERYKKKHASQGKYVHRVLMITVRRMWIAWKLLVRRLFPRKITINELSKDKGSLRCSVGNLIINPFFSTGFKLTAGCGLRLSVK